MNAGDGAGDGAGAGAGTGAGAVAGANLLHCSHRFPALPSLPLRFAASPISTRSLCTRTPCPGEVYNVQTIK